MGANNIFNFVYNTLQLSTLDPVNDVGLAQMVMGSQTHGVTPMALAAAFQIFYDGEYTTPHLYTRVLDRDGNIYMESNDTSYQALTPQTAYVMNRLLKNVLFSSVGTASGRYPNSNGMEHSVRPVRPAMKRTCGSWAVRPITSPLCGGAMTRPSI